MPPANPVAGWFPSPDYVDVVGIDVYPGPGSPFPAFMVPSTILVLRENNKHFCIGETGANRGSFVANKEPYLR